jgi:hypothetical protein
MSSLSINVPLPSWAEPWTNSESPDLAGSPQAKGRIERLWGFFEDRLVSELRLAKAKTLEQAQAVLDGYCSSITASSPTPLSTARLEKSQRRTDRTGLCFKEKRTMANDNTITFDSVLFQILRNLAIVPTPIRELTCMCFWTAWWSFSINKKKSPPLTLKKRTHLAYIERTRNGSPLWTYFQSTTDDQQLSP